MSNAIKIAVFLLCLFFFSSISWGMGEAPDMKDTKEIGKVAADFNLRSLSGAEVRLSEFKGKVVFLNFWATWCPPCRQEMPSMQALHEKMKNEDFIILAVALDKGGEAMVRPFIEKNNYTFKVLLDPKGEVATQYGAMSIPTTCIIDKNGLIAKRSVGSEDWVSEENLKKLKAILQK